MRRTILIRYSYKLLAPLTFVNDFHSALEEVEERSLKLLGKGKATHFVDEGGNFGEVANVVEQFREAVIRYQVSKNRLVGPGATHNSRCHNGKQSMTKSPISL